MQKLEGGSLVGGGGSPPHDVRRIDDSTRGAIKSLYLTRSGGFGVGRQAPP